MGLQIAKVGEKGRREMNQRQEGGREGGKREGEGGKDKREKGVSGGI